MNYGEKISYLRKSKGMTQEDLGKVLNVTYQAVSKWERGESLPDFNMMSQIAKFFEVPLSYFEDGGENIKPAEQAPQVIQVVQPVVAPATEPPVGMCTKCGKMLKKDEIYTHTPKIICKSCAARMNQHAEMQRQKDLQEQLGDGINFKLILCGIFALVAYIILAIACFSDSQDRESAATLLMLVPLAVFALPFVIFGFIDDLRDNDGAEGYRLWLSLIVGAVFAVINIILFLVLYIMSGSNGYFLVLLAVGTIVSFTFISQFMWGSVVREIFTCGGFSFKLPGFIISLSIESCLWMIIVKTLLGILSVIILVVTTILLALVAIFGSVFTFIPCLLHKLAKDRQARGNA